MDGREAPDLRFSRDLSAPADAAGVPNLRLHSRAGLAKRRFAALHGRQPGFTNGPYGYGIVRKDDVFVGRVSPAMLGKYYVVEEEARWVEVIFAEYLRTASSRSVIQTLEAGGAPPPGRGKGWTRHAIYRVLRNPVCIGMGLYGRTSVESRESGVDGADSGVGSREAASGTGDSRHATLDSAVVIPSPPIISREVFYAAQAVLAMSHRTNTVQCKVQNANCKMQSGGGPTEVGKHRFREALLRGMIDCGDCGGAMMAGSYERCAARKGGLHYACRKCEPTWNALEAPHVIWSTYPAGVVEGAARAAIEPLLPADERSFVLGALFDPAWGLSVAVRRRLLRLACLQFRLFNHPFRVELEFLHTSEHPEAAAGLVQALVDNTRFEYQAVR